MKKYILGVFILLILAISSTIYAQTKLDPNIYDENGFRLDQKIEAPQSDSSSTSSDIDIPNPPQEPQINTQAFKQGEPASCFDYYTFGSIHTNLQTDANRYEAGSPVLIQGQIKNNNRYPLTNLTIRARLVRDIPNPEYLRSEIITVDDFNVAENITLNASSSLDIQYSHLLPLNAPEGTYQLYFYAYNNDRFNQAGLSFTNDITAARLSFDVTGNNPQHVYLDQTNITLNDQEHNVMAFMTQHEKDIPIKVSIPLVNPSNKAEDMTVTYTLYKWDGLRKENIVDTKTETVSVPAKGEVQLTYTANKTDTSVYFLNIKADNTNLKKDKSVYDIETQSNIRFVVNGYDFPRVNSFGVDTYPIKANQEATLFTCYHNGATQDTINPVNITTTLYDQKGKEIAKTEYEGKIGGDINAIIKKFTLKKDLVNYRVVTELKDNNGKTIDKIENEYNCKDIDPKQCPPESNGAWMRIVLGLLVLVGIIGLIMKMKNKINVPTVLFILVVLILPMVGGQRVEGAIATTPFNMEIKLSRSPLANTDNWLVSEAVKGALSGSFNKTVDFVKDGINLSNINENILNKGDVFSLATTPTTGEWFFIGQILDSPPMDGFKYSGWNCSASDVKCTSDFNITSVTTSLDDFYVSVSVPLEKGIINITTNDPNKKVLSCTNLGCEAVGVGTAEVVVSFVDVNQVSPYFSSDNNGFWKFDNVGFGQVNMELYTFLEFGGSDYKSETFSFSPIVYTITVPPTANTPHTTSCAGTTNISSTSATVNWSYSDVDNDPQSQYQVQLATKSYSDPTFNLATDVAFSASGANANTSHTFTNLATTTTYYARIKTQNGANGWSTVWTGETGGGTACSSFKTHDDPNQPTLSLSCPNTSVTIPLNSSSANKTLTTGVVQNGTSPYTYKWYNPSNALEATHSNQSSATDSYTATIATSTNPNNPPSSNTWGLSYTVNVVDTNSNSATTTCYVSVTDYNLEDQCNNIDGSQFTVPTGTTRQSDGKCTCNNGATNPPTCSGTPPPSSSPVFKFAPNIAGIDKMCSYVLTVSNVSKCYTKNRLGISSGDIATNTLPNSIIIDKTKKLSIGAHTLHCIGTDTIDRTYNTEICYSNSEFKER